MEGGEWEGGGWGGQSPGWQAPAPSFVDGVASDKFLTSRSFGLFTFSKEENDLAQGTRHYGTFIEA